MHQQKCPGHTFWPLFWLCMVRLGEVQRDGLLKGCTCQPEPGTALH